MSLTHILESAVGQLVAIAIVVIAWTVVKLWQFLSTFTSAALQTRVEIVCTKKKA
jgi:hypothetical protein